MIPKRIKHALPYLIALILGAGQTFAFAPFSVWFLVPLLLGTFIYQLSQWHDNRQWLLGFSFGLGWFGAGISWVHISISEFGGLPLIGSLGLMGLLCGYLALYPAVVFYGLKRFFPVKTWPLALPLLWLTMEWLRSWVLTGFPWLSLGYSQIESPLSGWMPLIGETGVSLVLVFVASILACYFPHKRFMPIVTVITVFYVSGWVLDKQQWVETKAPPVSITMVQGNIKQELRWVPEQDWPTMMKYWDLTEPHWQSDIIIWPEAAIPKLEPLALEFIERLDDLAAEKGTGLVTGIVNYNFENQQAFNSLIGLGLSHKEDMQGQYRYFHNNRYAKHHLLPIGEFIPLENWLRGLAPIFDLPMSSFSRGEYRQQNMMVNDHAIAPAICFEIAFPRQIGANLTANTDFILTVSNDAWFGGSHGPDQHLEIARVRAKEFGTPVLRATNNGITAFIDHRGTILERAPQFVAQSISAKVQPMSGITPYRYFSDSLSIFISAALFLLALWQKRKALAAHKA